MTCRTWVLTSALLSALLVHSGSHALAQEETAPAGGGAAVAPALIPPAVADKPIPNDAAKSKPEAPKAAAPGAQPAAAAGGETAQDNAAEKKQDAAKEPEPKATAGKTSDDQGTAKPLSVINAKDTPANNMKDKPEAQSKNKAETTDKKLDSKDKAAVAPAAPKPKAAAPKPKTETKAKTPSKTKKKKTTTAKPKTPEVLPWATKPGTAPNTKGAAGPAYRAKASETCKGLFEALCRETPACTWVANIRIESGPDIKAHCMDRPGSKKKAKKKTPQKPKSSAKKAAATKPPDAKKAAPAKPVPQKPVKPVVEVPPATGTLSPQP